MRSHATSSIITTTCFQDISLDITDSSSNLTSLQGHRYSIILTDYHSKFRWIYFTKKKPDFLKQYLLRFEDEEVISRNATVSIYLSDEEPLYLTPEVLASLRGTFPLRIAPYRSELNPAEPVIGAIQDCARTFSLLHLPLPNPCGNQPMFTLS